MDMFSSSHIDVVAMGLMADYVVSIFTWPHC